MNYQFNSYVNRQEAESLKEMIFQRARERAQSMMSDVQADVMSVARESFVSNNNPFSQIISTPAEEVQTPKTQETIQPSEQKTTAIHEYVEAAEAKAAESAVGFPQRPMVTQAANQYRVIQEQASARAVQDTMRAARDGLSNKQSFMGALAFLNSQAAVSLMNKRAGRGVDVVA